MCFRIWCSGKISRHDRVLSSVVHHNPDVTWPKHCRCGGDELLSQSFDRGEGCNELLLESVGDRDLTRGEGGVEEVVVVSHAGVVE